MNLTAKIESAKLESNQQDARTLPAPPAALWTFAVLFTVSAVWAILHV